MIERQFLSKQKGIVMTGKQVKVALTGMILAAAGLGCALVGAEPADKPFKALVLPNTKKNVIADDYNPQIKDLGITPVYVTSGQVADGSAFDLLADCEMMLVPPPFEGRMTNGAEKVRAWIEKGGMFLMHDAVYPNRMKWLSDVDPALALKGHGNCRYVKMTPVEPVSPLLTTPRKVGYGGYWGHMGFVSNAVWRPVVQCPHSNHCNMAFARFGKGVGYASAQWQGDTTPMIVNLRANAALIANDLSLVSSDVKEPVAGDNAFVATVRNDGKAEQAVSLVYNGRDKSSVRIAAGETKEIVLKVRIAERGPRHARVTLECAGLKAYLFDNDVRIRRLFEVGSTRYRNLLSPGRRYEEIQFLSTVSPIDEKTEGAVARLEVVKDGQVLTSLDTPAVARGAMRTKARFPKDLKSGTYTVRGTLLSAAGGTLDADETAVEILEPVPGLTCIDEDMNFIVDDEPFLPLGMYHARMDEYDEVCENGINMIQQFGWHWSVSISEAFRRGMRVNFSPWEMSVEQHAAAYAHNPGLMMWYLQDEPGEKDIPKGIALNDAYHAADRLHPTYICSCTPALFDRFGVIADVFAPDPYPHTWDDPGIVGRWMDKAYEVCGDRNPLVCIPQSHLMETHSEWLAMTHLALCHRSKGVFWYCWSQQGGGTLGVGIKHNEHRKDLPVLVGRFRAMAPALLNTPEADYFVKDGVHGMSCRDPELGTRYMIVVNPQTNGAPLTAKVEWKGAAKANRVAKGAFGSADFPMADGVVDVRLAPLEFRTLAVDGPVPAPEVQPAPPAAPKADAKPVAVAAGGSIQAAVDAAEPGAVITVPAGTYAPFSSANKFVTVRAPEGPERTFIDAKGEGRAATLTAKPFGNLFGETNTVVEGFTLRNGRADRTRFNRHRGGLALGGTFRNCRFEGGTAQYGGAAAYARLEGCALRGNHATKSGGAGFCVTSSGSDFTDNTSDFDGGAVSFSEIEGGTVSGNRAGRDAGGMSYGAARGTTFLRNEAKRYGGAVYAQELITRSCVFAENRAGVAGGGAYSTVTELSTYVGNVAPKGGAVCRGAAEGCIVWKNDVAETTRVNRSLVGKDPKFVKGTYVPAASSPAVDLAGISVPRGETDAAGRARVIGVLTDAGAYEVGGAKVDRAAAGTPLSSDVSLEEEAAPLERVVALPAGKYVGKVSLKLRFRYRPKAKPGEIATLTFAEGDLAMRIGVITKGDYRNHVYGTVGYRQFVGSGSAGGGACERRKVSLKGFEKPNEWHEAVLTVDAAGRDAGVSAFTYDGVECAPDWPWCRDHRQTLKFSNGKLVLSPDVEFETVEVLSL